MVCTREELEQIHQEDAASQAEDEGNVVPLDDDGVWWLLQELLNPEKSRFGPFESTSPFEDDLDAKVRRRIVAVNMLLDPTTTTWYGLSCQYGPFYKKDRQNALKQRLQALGLEPKHEAAPYVQRERAEAFERGLNPFTATFEDIAQLDLALYKVLLPKPLAWQAYMYLRKQPMGFGDLLQRALESYLSSQSGAPK